MYTIAVVDDDPDIVRVFTHFLTLMGFSATPFSDPSDALKKIPAMTPVPDLIMLDLMMTPITGIQFLEARRRDPRLVRIPVVIVSAWDLKGNDPETYDSDIRGIIKKPVLPSALKIAIESILDKQDSPGK